MYQQIYKSYINKRELLQINTFYLVTIIVKPFACGFFDTSVGLSLNLMFTINQFIIIFPGIKEELHFVFDKHIS